MFTKPNISNLVAGLGILFCHQWIKLTIADDIEHRSAIKVYLTDQALIVFFIFNFFTVNLSQTQQRFKQRFAAISKLFPRLPDLNNQVACEHKRHEWVVGKEQLGTRFICVE